VASLLSCPRCCRRRRRHRHRRCRHLLQRMIALTLYGRYADSAGANTASSCCTSTRSSSTSYISAAAATISICWVTQLWLGDAHSHRGPSIWMAVEGKCVESFRNIHFTYLDCILQLLVFDIRFQSFDCGLQTTTQQFIKLTFNVMLAGASFKLAQNVMKNVLSAWKMSNFHHGSSIC